MARLRTTVAQRRARAGHATVESVVLLVVVAVAGAGAWVTMGEDAANSIASHGKPATVPAPRAMVTSRQAAAQELTDLAHVVAELKAPAHIAEDAAAFERTFGSLGTVWSMGPPAVMPQTTLVEELRPLIQRPPSAATRRALAEVVFEHTRRRAAQKAFPRTEDLERTIRALAPELGDPLVAQFSQNFAPRFEAIAAGALDTNLQRSVLLQAFDALRDGNAVALDRRTARPLGRGVPYADLDAALAEGHALWADLAKRFGDHAEYVPSPELRAFADATLRFMQTTLTERSHALRLMAGLWRHDGARAGLREVLLTHGHVAERLAERLGSDVLSWADWWDLSEQYAGALEAGHYPLGTLGGGDVATSARPYLPMPTDTLGYWDFSQAWEWRNTLLPVEIPSVTKPIGQASTGAHGFFTHDLGHVVRSRAKLAEMRASGELRWLEDRFDALREARPQEAELVRSVLGEYVWEAVMPRVTTEGPRAGAGALVRQWLADFQARKP